MTLSDQCAHAFKDCRQVLDEQRQRVSKIGRAAPHLYADLLEISHCALAVLARLSELEAIIAAKRMTTSLEPLTAQRGVEDLELFGQAQECLLDLMLASLHRAGDHTLDGEEGA